MKNIIIPFLILVLLIFPTIIAVESNLGVFKQNEQITLKQICSSCSFVNITSVIYPNSSSALGQVSMNKDGSEYTYNFVNTGVVGQYIVSGLGDPDGVNTIWTYSFDVTAWGKEAISNGESSIIIIGIILMLVIIAFFFILGVKAENWAIKTILIGTSALLLLTTFIFSIVIISQTLGGFETIVEGYSTLWFVLEIIIGMIMLGLVIFSVVIAYKVWMVKRGFRDE